MCDYSMEDSHAYLMPGAIDLPKIEGPQWDGGVSCLEDDQGRPAVYYVDPCGPAEKAGVKVGMVVMKVDGNDAAGVIEQIMARMKKYGAFSSERHLRYFAFHFFMRQMQKGRVVEFEMLDNTGGGFEQNTSHVNFCTDGDATQPHRLRYKGPMAVLIDNRCISAGEGWASWFVANKRAKLLGQTTAGASARREIYLLKNGLYKVRYPVKAYTGFLDRPIERRGIEPDLEVKQNADDLVRGRDTVLEAAREYLRKPQQSD
ncbi:MAG TPA: S41 family peptidase [Sedimentisphaerales bacterium]|nr:S41 family peptidase [Sedimentisphaerales bacterium]